MVHTFAIRIIETFYRKKNSKASEVIFRYLGIISDRRKIYKLANHSGIVPRTFYIFQLFKLFVNYYTETVHANIDRLMTKFAENEFNEIERIIKIINMIYVYG